jgi:hypothetical protein
VPGWMRVIRKTPDSLSRPRIAGVAPEGPIAVRVASPYSRIAGQSGSSVRLRVPSAVVQ